MDILIKSFNRPYYLDRCLQSIYLNCVGSNFTVKVLDDGTPEKYLNKIQQQYPNIIIYKSQYYNDKSKFCEQGIKPENMKIPIDFWVSSATNSSDYFILLEDDIWFTEKFDFNTCRENMIQNKSVFTKLFWLGNSKLIQSKSTNSIGNLSFLEPNLYVSNPNLFSFIFYKFNRFKIRKILIFLKIHTKERFLSYYSIYSVASAIFKKDYFLSLWNNHKNTVDEGLQLFNAVTYFNRNKNEITFSHTHSEVLKTGFLSSATNQFKDFDVQVDMFAFNKIINEIWYKNELDVMNNYPSDLSVNEIEKKMKSENVDLTFINDWKEWVLTFKNQYVNFGCKID